MYESLANTTLSKIAKLNNDHRQSSRGRRSYVNKPYTNLHFTAIDCGEFGSLCSKESVTSYPTLVMLNVKHAAEKIVGPNLKSATKFVNEKYFDVQVSPRSSRCSTVPVYLTKIRFHLNRTGSWKQPRRACPASRQLVTFMSPRQASGRSTPRPSSASTTRWPLWTTCCCESFRASGLRCVFSILFFCSGLHNAYFSPFLILRTTRRLC